ncbi:MAG: septum formation initiator [Campylobacterota bacterium]|nr:septum formation initiator [Campylobacterota bacterium]
MEKIDVKQQNRRFIFISSTLVVITFVLAYYISDLLFYGKSSYEVYANLQDRKIKLQQDIKILQIKNATLQKKYFELKNLEPEEL